MPWPRDRSAVVDARFYSHHPRTFTVTTSRTTRGRGFTFTDGASGAAAMQVDKAHFGGYKRLRSLLFLDASRRALLTVEESLYAFRRGRRWEGFMARGTGRADLLFLAVDKTPILTFSTTTLHVFLGGGEIRVPDFVVHGNYYGAGRMTVSDSGGAAVAQIGKKTTVWGSLVGEHTYTVRVNPGIDQAFVLALTVILDQMHNVDHDARCYHHSCGCSGR